MFENTLLITTLICAAGTGVMFAYLLIFHLIAQRQRARGKGELRRQARAYQAKLDAQERAHAAEVAALREAIRYERGSLRPHDAVARCTIHKRPLLNRQEYNLFTHLEALVANLPNNERLFAQVSLVEVFAARATDDSAQTRRAAFEAYGAMRCDFLLVDRGGYPLCGIEYQGTGHHQGNFAYREQIKREVFRKAGVPLVEVAADMAWPEIESRLRGVIRAPLLAA